MLEVLQDEVGCMAQLGLKPELVGNGAVSLFFSMKPLLGEAAGAWIALDTINKSGRRWLFASGRASEGEDTDVTSCRRPL